MRVTSQHGRRGVYRALCPRSNHGFTLIEILVVVAIIALLVAILLPSLKRARWQAKLVACRANLHDFGMALQQYADGSRGYFPIPCYVGTRIYETDPSSDDNLITLWLGRYTRNVNTYSCPATPYMVRTPERIDKVTVPGKGVRYDVYTAGELRNDFECHGQVIKETLAAGGSIIVHLNGTSYEYDGGWGTFSFLGSDGLMHEDDKITTTPNWYPFNSKGKSYSGAAKTLNNVKRPSVESEMRDADEGGGNGGDIVGAPPDRATNNLPEPWDNHGAKVSNLLHFDGHVVSYPYAYWEAIAKKKGGTYIGY